MRHSLPSMLSSMVLLLMLFILGCNKQDSGHTNDNTWTDIDARQQQTLTPTPKQHQRLAFSTSFFDAATQQIQQLNQENQKFSQAIKVFLQTSNEKNWLALKTQWLISHEHWHLSESYFASERQYQERFAALLSSAHSAPIIAGYLDTIEGYPFSGIVNDITVPITERAIMDQHQRYDASEIAVGMHAVEFFLWGRTIDDYKPQAPINSAAPTIDPNTNEETLSAEEQPVFRRRQYLELLGDLLVKNGNQIQAQWQLLARQFAVTPSSRTARAELKNALRQLQQLEPHSPYQNTDTISTQYHWQASVVSQLQQWLTLQKNTFINNEDATRLQGQLDNLQKEIATFKTESSADHTTFNALVGAISADLKLISKQVIPE